MAKNVSGQKSIWECCSVNKYLFIFDIDSKIFLNLCNCPAVLLSHNSLFIMVTQFSLISYLCLVTKV